MANRDLKNTILMPDEAGANVEYNINAVYSDEAGKVTTPLVIKESLVTGESSGSFNGDNGASTKQEINYVPATGGKFTGPVHIVASDPPENASIINYGQIETLVNLLTGSSAFAWAPNNKAIPQLDTIKNNAGQIENLRVVVGTTDHFATFKKLLGTGSSELTIDGNGTVTGVSEIKQTVVIPCKYNNKPVTSIGSCAFYDKKFGGTSIRFSSNITNIASDAFGPAPNTTGPNIKYIIYDGTKDEWDSLMSKLAAAGGSTYDIFDFIADVGNVIITSNIKDYIDGPFIYICNDYEDYDYTDSDPRIRQMYLKLPNNPDFIEISTNAIRLTSWEKTAENKYYYTYEGLAEIIARINTRLDGLGLKVTTTALAPLPSIEDVNDLVPEGIEVTESFNPDAVPTIEDLTKALVKIHGSDWDENRKDTGSNGIIVDNLNTVLGIADNLTLTAIREDLDDLTTEVRVGLNGDYIAAGVDSRLDDIEKNHIGITGTSYTTGTYASEDAYGHVKIGSNLTADNGVISLDNDPTVTSIHAGTFHGDGSDVSNLDADNITSGTLDVANGGTGQTTLAGACNSLINSLSLGTSVPEDDDFYVCQYTGGGTTTTTYHRRSISKLYEYVQTKTDSRYLKLTGGEVTGNLTVDGITNKIGNLYIQYFGNDGNDYCEIKTATPTGATTGYKQLKINASETEFNNQVKAPSFNAISDARLKENFEPLQTEKSILDLPTYKFDFKNGAKNQIGCKAQDLQEICPEIVNEGSDGYLSIQESKIVYLLLDEIKKLRKEVDELKRG
jgi:hypothetical protein